MEMKKFHQSMNEKQVEENLAYVASLWIGD
jgi:hypothetical protein